MRVEFDFIKFKKKLENIFHCFYILSSLLRSTNNIALITHKEQKECMPFDNWVFGC